MFKDFKEANLMGKILRAVIVMPATVVLVLIAILMLPLLLLMASIKLIEDTLFEHEEWVFFIFISGFWLSVLYWFLILFPILELV